MLLRINSENPEGRKIRQVVESLQDGGVIIYPTDTVYGLGCDIFDQKAVEKICRLRSLDPKKAMLSIVCKDISQISEFAAQIDNNVFKLLKRHLPGPFTFVLKAGNGVPKLFKNRKHTIGVRVPNNQIVLDIVEALGHPILTTSLKSDDEILEYFTDPIDIYEDFKKLVDIVIDGGIGGNVPSTVIDCTDDVPALLRAGAGEWA
ncbi:L-threonylcarbamoyladenylate synthase [Flavilitoribacter nigricans]|uniref:Threonylcarbamoyl-AMP synthase n=1 Tax=Flavilitoribacter nigricans (strain ATCC 23147 / DSM 23189 / NBRC 102662 / NCIMB 1420 / SS-2) TaxID=1122177 RepID=A0A2D0NG77_FLAN2|nr:L-threonylcarbamoyladenylate synthase [Flavilitoribacter nigricans]PHN07477.1 threonylcarbamoyl-AMP synthase [Flavilitoribacter nigricans DSM 23189 = NBRC 102662]